ncbi:MAG: hypothetical protein QGH76_06245 [Phycisphaerales bacterium]|nr:hypothetical protein [Phycisphaerales bacterium]
MNAWPDQSDAYLDPPDADASATSLTQLVRPLRIAMQERKGGYVVDVSTLGPGDAMMALTSGGLGFQQTILCGAGSPQWVACMEGPVEAGDAEAIAAGIRAGDDPLASDVRLDSVITSHDGTAMRAWLRREDDALAIIGEALRQYAAEIPPTGGDVGSPELGLVDSLISRSHHLSIRPIETSVYSTFIDIGICLSPGGSGPADHSVIYDTLARSWHTD